MKKLCLFSVVFLAATALQAQMSVSTCKQILKLLPATMQSLSANEAKDRVIDAEGAIGVTIRRVYGTPNSNVSVKIIGNSLSLSSADGILAEAASNPAKYVVADIGGYKAFVQKFRIEDGKTGFELFLPLDKALLTLSTAAFTQDAVIAMAKTIPVAKIDGLIK